MKTGKGITVGLYRELIDYMRMRAKQDEYAREIMERYDARLQQQHTALKN